jgi:hypothetical protein
LKKRKTIRNIGSHQRPRNSPASEPAPSGVVGAERYVSSEIPTAKPIARSIRTPNRRGRAYPRTSAIRKAKTPRKMQAKRTSST